MRLRRRVTVMVVDAVGGMGTDDQAGIVEYLASRK
jgi:hypothetical protein